MIGEKNSLNKCVKKNGTHFFNTFISTDLRILQDATKEQALWIISYVKETTTRSLLTEVE
jgi:hypothetical protein